MPVKYKSADVVISGPREIIVPPGTSVSFSAEVREFGVTTADSVIWELRWGQPYLMDYEGNYQPSVYPGDGSLGIVGSVSSGGGVYRSVDDRRRRPDHIWQYLRAAVCPVV